MVVLGIFPLGILTGLYSVVYGTAWIVRWLG